MNENIAGFMTCPICKEPHQEVRINKNRKLYMFCDNGCSVKLNNIQSKRYLPVLLGGSDVKDENFGLIISAAKKGKTQNEIIKQKEVRNAGFEEVRKSGKSNNFGESGNGSSTGSLAGSRTGSRSDFDGRTAGNDNGNTGHHETAIGRAVKWLVADDDDE